MRLHRVQANTAAVFKRDRNRIRLKRSAEKRQEMREMEEQDGRGN